MKSVPENVGAELLTQFGRDTAARCFVKPTCLVSLPRQRAIGGQDSLRPYRLAELWRLGQRKNYDLFARERANVVVQAARLETGDVLN